MATLLLLTLPILALCAPNSPPPARDECTTTITALDRGFQGAWAPYVEKTIFTTTSVVYTAVPCGGCALTSVTVRAPFWGGHGPIEQVTATVTAKTPFITTSAICALDRSGVKRGEVEGETRTCTVTSMLPGSFTFGLTKTVWPNTVTTTKRVDCGGCQHVVRGGRDFAEAQDVIRIGWLATTTAKTAYTSTRLACRRTPMAIPALPVERKVQERYVADREVEERQKEAEAEIERRGPVPSYTIYRPTTSARPGTPCTITALVSPTDDMGPTTTLYPVGTVRRMQGVECRGCKVESHTVVLNWFVSPVYEATETHTGPSTRLSFACTDI